MTVQRPIDDQALAAMAAGMPLSGKMTRPARVHRLSAKRFRIVLQEGMNRQIRRMVQKVGNRVMHLNRIRVVDSAGNIFTAPVYWLLISVAGSRTV